MGRRGEDFGREAGAFTGQAIVFAIKFWIMVFSGVGLLVLWLRRRNQSRRPDIGNPEFRTRHPEPLPDERMPLQSRKQVIAIVCIVVSVVWFIGASPGVLAWDPKVPRALAIIPFVMGCGLFIFVITEPKPAPAETSAETPSPREAQAPELLGVIYTITVPASTEWGAETAWHFVEQVASQFPHTSFRIVATHEAIQWQIVDLAKFEPDIIEKVIRSAYPKAEVAIEPLLPDLVEHPYVRYITFYQQVNMFIAPLVYVTDIKEFDYIGALSQALSGLKAGERVAVTLALGGIAGDAYIRAEKALTQSTIHPLQLLSQRGIGDAITKYATGHDRAERFIPRQQKVMEAKFQQKLFYAALMMQVDAPDMKRLAEILVLIDAQTHHVTNEPYNALTWVERPIDTLAVQVTTELEAFDTDAITLLAEWGSDILAHRPARHIHPPRLVLEPRELAALWHLPHEDCTAPRITWASGLAPVPEGIARLEKGIVLGTGRYQGSTTTVHLPEADRVTHLNIIGKTGTGKSTFLHHLIHQDIAAGHGIAVIDPHGKLVRDVLHSCIPPQREADVVLLDLANETYPPPLNPLIGISGYTETLQVVSIIERLFSGTEQAARMASYLRAALIPLQTQTQVTMRDLSRLFMDNEYREALLNQIDDPETQDFWDYHYNPASAALQRQIAEPILNRIRPFYANPHLYPILCHPDTLNFRELIAQKKIILISLAVDEERVPKQERDLIGALLMSRLQMSGMKGSSSTPFFVYVDEVQRFVTSSLPELLSEARKYGLSLVTANQFLGQLEGKTLEAFMGNVGTTVAFRCSPDDARTLESYMKPEMDALVLSNFDRFQAAVKMQVNGQTQPAFGLMSLSPLDVPDDAESREVQLRDMSAKRYTPKTREDILTWLRERYPRRRTPSRATGDEATFYD